RVGEHNGCEYARVKRTPVVASVSIVGVGGASTLAFHALIMSMPASSTTTMSTLVLSCSPGVWPVGCCAVASCNDAAQARKVLLARLLNTRRLHDGALKNTRSRSRAGT